LELLVVTLPLLGHIEHLSPLTWCPRNLTLSNPSVHTLHGDSCGAARGGGRRYCGRVSSHA
ncbi:MAG: hypothetical protein U0H36_00005, partial [Eggerthellaceae bacterium]|nr:hypothetical protein [Eggerthellaceae bacterium]